MQAHEITWQHGTSHLVFEPLDLLARLASLTPRPPIITQPYPEPMRLRGLENARKCDIEQHKGLFTEAWEEAARLRQDAR